MLAFILSLLVSTSQLSGALAHALKVHAALSQAPPEAIASARLAASDALAASQDIAAVRAAEEEADAELDGEEEDDSDADDAEPPKGDDHSAQLLARAPAKVPAKLSAVNVELPAQVRAEDLWEAIDDDLPTQMHPGISFGRTPLVVPPATIAFSSQADADALRDRELRMLKEEFDKAVKNKDDAKAQRDRELRILKEEFDNVAMSKGDAKEEVKREVQILKQKFDKAGMSKHVLAEEVKGELQTLNQEFDKVARSKGDANEKVKREVQILKQQFDKAGMSEGDAKEEVKGKLQFLKQEFDNVAMSKGDANEKVKREVQILKQEFDKAATGDAEQQRDNRQGLQQIEATRKAVKRQPPAGKVNKAKGPPAKSRGLGGKSKETTKGPAGPANETTLGHPGPTKGAKGPIPQYGRAGLDNPDEVCEKLCERDSGMDGDKQFCLTDCRTYVDAGGDLQDLKEFVIDEAYNEKGGNEMKDAFEEMTGEEIPECELEVKISSPPTFAEMDLDGNGEILYSEGEIYGHKMCIPDEMVYQMLYHADVDMSHSISPAEFNAAGESTKLEQMFDSYLDGFTEGEDEYERVALPKFTEFDSDGDGFLDNLEIQDMLKFELVQRVPSIHEDEVNYVLTYFVQSGEVSNLLAIIDVDKDGKISPTEYSRGGSGGGMGVEFMEAANADEDKPDPDDLHRDPNQKPGPVVAIPPAPAPAPAIAPAPKPQSLPRSPIFLRRRQI